MPSKRFKKVFFLSIPVVLIGMIISPYDYQVYFPMAYGGVFAISGAYSAYIGYNVSNHIIDKHKDLLEKHHIGHFHVGLNPMINLNEVANKLKDEPAFRIETIQKIEKQKALGLITVLSFLLMPVLSILLFVIRHHF